VAKIYSPPDTHTVWAKLNEIARKSYQVIIIIIVTIVIDIFKVA